jgi:CTP synthase (UTP-ammonia lyase)
MLEADHEESAPDAAVKLISKLTCSLVGQERIVRILPNTQAHRAYGKDESTEIFACNYGLNESFHETIASKDLRISGLDEEGTVRMMEVASHPFAVSTLFVPQMLSSPEHPHPLIIAYLQAALQFRKH